MSALRASAPASSRPAADSSAFVPTGGGTGSDVTSSELNVSDVSGVTTE